MQDAADEKGRRGTGLVLLAGIATTALTLLGVWWLDNHTRDFNVMGWYADYVLPVGALLVGLAAGSGYGVASYLTGLRIRRGLLLGVLALQLLAYGAAQYLEFRSMVGEVRLVDESGEELSFARFYHLRAINWRWTEHGRTGDPLGGWGYIFLGLGVLGFALGGVIAPAVLMKVPYCEQCELYMKTRALALVPASVRARRVSKKDTTAQAAYQQEQDGAATTAATLLSQVTGLAARGDALGIKSALASHPTRGGQARAAGRLPARLRVSLVRCRQCATGWLQPAMITGQGRAIRVSALERVTMPDGTARQIAES